MRRYLALYLEGNLIEKDLDIGFNKSINTSFVVPDIDKRSLNLTVICFDELQYG